MVKVSGFRNENEMLWHMTTGEQMKLSSISSGSQGNCILVENENTTLLVDVGISKKKVEEGLSCFNRNPEEIDGILITHEHMDHIKGLGVFLRKYHIPVYATEKTIDYILHKSDMGKIDSDLFFVIEKNKSFDLKNLKILPLPISHDALDPVCFRFDEDSTGNKSCAIATDIGETTKELILSLQELDGILIESNHDIRMLQMSSYPYNLKQRIWGNKGHLSNEACGNFINEIISRRLKKIVLGHLSQENNYPELAFQAVRNEINFADHKFCTDDIDLKVASRTKPSCNIEF